MNTFLFLKWWYSRSRLMSSLWDKDKTDKFKWMTTGSKWTLGMIEWSGTCQSRIRFYNINYFITISVIPLSGPIVWPIIHSCFGILISLGFMHDAIWDRTIWHLTLSCLVSINWDLLTSANLTLSKRHKATPIVTIAIKC